MWTATRQLVDSWWSLGRCAAERDLNVNRPHSRSFSWREALYVGMNTSSDVSLSSCLLIMTFYSLFRWFTPDRLNEDFSSSSSSSSSCPSHYYYSLFSLQSKNYQITSFCHLEISPTHREEPASSLITSLVSCNLDWIASMSQLFANPKLGRLK